MRAPLAPLGLSPDLHSEHLPFRAAADVGCGEIHGANTQCAQANGHRVILGGIFALPVPVIVGRDLACTENCAGRPGIVRQTPGVLQPQGGGAVTVIDQRHGSRERDKLTIVEVCADLRVSRRTFYEWRAKGRAPRCITLPNGSLRVRRSEYLRWLSSREEMP